MTTNQDWRALCEELVLGWDVDGCDWKPQHQARWNAAIERARALLAQPEPEVVGPTLQLPEQAPDEHPPSNLDRREVAAWYHGHGCGWQAARAVLARFGHQPAPAPVEAEVAELALKELERTMVLLMPVTGKNKIKRFDTIRAALKRLHELENKADLSPAPPAPKPADG